MSFTKIAAYNVLSKVAAPKPYPAVQPTPTAVPDPSTIQGATGKPLSAMQKAMRDYAFRVRLANNIAHNSPQNQYPQLIKPKQYDNRAVPREPQILPPETVKPITLKYVKNPDGTGKYVRKEPNTMLQTLRDNATHAARNVSRIGGELARYGYKRLKNSDMVRNSSNKVRDFFDHVRQYNDTH